MKRVIVFIFLIILLLPLSFIEKKDCLDFDYEKITVVSEKSNLNLSVNVVKSGKDYYYTVEKESKKIELKDLDFDNVKGIVLYISKKYSIDYFKKIFNYNISYSKIIEEKNIYTGYYKDYDDYRIVDGKKIIFQLVEYKNKWILGFPLILTGF